METLQSRFPEFIEMFEEYANSKYGTLEQVPPDALATVKWFLNDMLTLQINFILQLQDSMTGFEVFIRNDAFVAMLGWEHYA